MATHAPRSRFPRVLTCLLLAVAASCKPSADPASGQRASAARGATAAATPAATPAAPAGGAASANPLLTRADEGRIQGQPSAPIWIIEISDFQCPYCKMWHDETYPAILKEYVQTGKARMAYLNFPLPSHQNAVPAAEATMCASAQGKFWQMHDQVFGAQERWSPLQDPSRVLDSLATAAGAEMTAWRECMATHATLPLIQADRDRGSGAGVRSTPSFLIGSEALAGAQPLSVFRETIEKALKDAASRPAGGAPPQR